MGATLLLAMACSNSAFAGNIFMKNGYIIQGRIVDRDATSVILGWPNGKVAIARRFVESVEYEHAEEERIRQLEQARQERPDEEEAYQPTALAESTDEGELPASLEMFIQKYQLEPLKHVGVDLEDPVDSAVTTTDPVDPVVPVDPANPVDPTDGSGTVGLVPDVVQVGEQGLAEEAVQSDSALVAIRPPKLWKRQSRDGFLAFTSEKGDGVRSSVNVVSMERGPLSAEDFVDLLREQQKTNLVSFELLSEGPTKVGERPAYEIAGRCSYEDHPAVVRQILVLIDARVWLFSAFAPEDSSATVDDTMALVDSMLDTVTFRTDATVGEDTRSSSDSLDAPGFSEGASAGDGSAIPSDAIPSDASPSDEPAVNEDAGLDDSGLDDAGLDDAGLDDDMDLDDDMGLDDTGLDDDVDLDDVDLDDVNLDDVDLDDVDLDDVDLDDVDVDLDDL